MWTGLGNKDKTEAKQTQAESSKAGASSAKNESMRQGLSRMGAWGFGGKNTDASKNNRTAEQSDEDDDHRIRFTIGGAGRRLTKDDFLKEIQSLDPKARCAVIEGSNAPAAMKAMAQKDASKDSPGSSRLFDAKNTQAAAGKSEATLVGAQITKQRGARVEEDGEELVERPKERKETVAKGKGSTPIVQLTTTLSTSSKSSSSNEPESAAERKRREKALRGIDDVTDGQRGRSPTRYEIVQPRETAATRRRRLAMEGGGESTRVQSPGIEGESAAERRRREAALGVGLNNQDDSDDDDTPRVPPPVARSRGIRFAQSPVRGK